jgi:hypothetical protein
LGEIHKLRVLHGATDRDPDRTQIGCIGFKKGRLCTVLVHESTPKLAYAPQWCTKLVSTGAGR